MPGRMMPDGFEEWREHTRNRVLVTVDLKPHGEKAHLVLGVGDENGIVWMTVKEAKWLRGRLDEAILAAAAVEQRRARRRAVRAVPEDEKP